MTKIDQALEELFQQLFLVRNEDELAILKAYVQPEPAEPGAFFAAGDFKALGEELERIISVTEDALGGGLLCPFGDGGVAKDLIRTCRTLQNLLVEEN